MSTTGGTELGTILILDPPSRLKKKIMSAVTDSGSEVRAAPDKPGVTALLEILSTVTDTPDPGARGPLRGRRLRRRSRRTCSTPSWRTWSRSRPATRSSRPIRTTVREALARGADKARALAVPTMARVREVVGLLPER